MFNSIDVGNSAQPAAIFSAGRTEPPCEIYRARQLVLMSQAGTLANERNLAAPIEADRQGVREWLVRSGSHRPLSRQGASLFFRTRA